MSQSREAGTNSRSTGRNPRAKGTNPRVAGDSPRIQGLDKRRSVNGDKTWRDYKKAKSHPLKIL